MKEAKGTVKCANPDCDKIIFISQWSVSPSSHTPPNHIHKLFDWTAPTITLLCKHCGHFTMNLSVSDRAATPSHHK